MDANGVYEVDGDEFKVLGFIPTGKGAHGLYTSRDSRVLYVSNRGREVSPSSISPNGAWLRRGGFLEEALPIWEESPPTARFCGCQGATAA